MTVAEARKSRPQYIPGTLQSHVKLWPSLESLKGKRGYCYEFLSFFISLNVLSHYAVLSSVGLIHASSIVSSYVLPFVLYIISYMVSIIYMYEHIVYIVDTELYCSLASL